MRSRGVNPGSANRRAAPSHRVLGGVLSALLVLGGACARPENDDPALAEAEQALTCPASPTDVNWARDLLITDVSLVEHARATSWSGIASNDYTDGTFHFGRLLNDLRGRDGNQQNPEGGADITYTPYELSEYVHRWLDEWETDDITNCDPVPGRPAVNTHIRNPWPKIAGQYDVYTTKDGRHVTRERLDMRNPPFRLMAVVFRNDLADLTPPRGHNAANDPQRDPPQAGELRIVYGLIDPATGAPKNLTVAFEYSLPAQTENDVTLWQKRWRQEVDGTTIGSTEWLNGVSRLVWEVTRNNGSRNATSSLYAGNPCLGCGQARPHDNNLHQVRTNDYKVLGATQEFREFRVPLNPSAGNGGGTLNHFYTHMTFRRKFQNTVKLARYLDSYCEHILAEHHKVPQDFPQKLGDTNDCAVLEPNSVQAGASYNDFSLWWNAPITDYATCGNATKNEVRHRFSRNTCNGCHGVEMGFRTDTAANNFMIRPRAVGVASTLSPFISSGTWSVQDPKDPTLTRDFTEMLSRRTKYRNVLCNGYTQPAYPTTWR